MVLCDPRLDVSSPRLSVSLAGGLRKKKAVMSSLEKHAK